MGSASPKDHAHFRAIAAGERESEDERIERALETPPGERMIAGSDLGAEIAWTGATLAELDARTDGQMELARRRIALGLDGRQPR